VPTRLLTAVGLFSWEPKITSLLINAEDVAGNNSNCSLVVGVPHDKRKMK
jgi:hypothetical protein